jgi:hypothetical protein
MLKFPMRQSWHVRLQSQQAVSVQDANRVGAQEARYAAMSVLYTQHSLGHQIGIRRVARSFQVSSGFIKQNLIFEGSQGKGRSEKFKNQEQLLVGVKTNIQYLANFFVRLSLYGGGPPPRTPWSKAYSQGTGIRHSFISGIRSETGTPKYSAGY